MNDDGEQVLEKMEHFGKRTKRLIVNMFHETKNTPLHEKVLCQTYKEAWRLKKTTLPDNSKGSDHLRGF